MRTRKLIPPQIHCIGWFWWTLTTSLRPASSFSHYQHQAVLFLVAPPQPTAPSSWGSTRRRGAHSSQWRRRASISGSEISAVAVGDDDDRVDRGDFDTTLLDDDVNYYRRRSDLLQKILDKRQEDDSLARDKLVILQDVVQRQSQRLLEEQLRWQRDQQQQQQVVAKDNTTADASRLKEEAAATAAAVAAANALHEKVNAAQLQTIEELRANATRANDAADRLRSALDKAEHSLAKRKGEMQHQQLYYQSQIDELRRSIAEAETEAERAREKLHSQRLLVEQSKQQHAHELDTQLAQAEERFNTSLQVARSKFESKLKEAHAKLQESENELLILRERDATHRRQVTEWEERLLIASASVQASEERENELAATIRQLRSAAAVRNDTIRHLQAQVEELRSHVLAIEGATNNASDTAAISPSSAVQDAAKIEDLEEQVRNLKHAHAAQLLSQRRQFERELRDLRERTALEAREAAAIGPTISVRAAASPAAPPRPSSASGAARRLWQRVKRPFQRR